MTKQTKKSGLLDRLKKSGVRDTTRYAPPEAPAGGSLPAGISGGIARLTRLDFDVMESGDYKGEQRLYAHGVCVSPKEFKDSDGNVHKTQGALVQLSKINLCDTTYQDKATPFAENWEKAENRLKLLGIPTEDLDDDEFENEVLEFVKSNELYFRFRTWKGQADTRVNVVLEGPVEYNAEAVSEVEDNTESPDDAPKKIEPEAQEAPQEEPKKRTRKSKEVPPVAEKEVEVPKEAQKEVEILDINDYPDKMITNLGKKGDKGDVESQKLLTSLADTLSIDVVPLNDWSDVAVVIIEKRKQTPAEPEETEVQPQKGDIFEYEGTEVEILLADVSRKKANIKNLRTKQTIKDVDFSELMIIED